MSEGFELHVDDDWKAQARKEKEKLAERDKARAEAQATQVAPTPTPTAEPTPVPGGASDADPSADAEPASFGTLLGSIASQAMLYLGLMPDPMSGRRIVGLDYARQQIDLLEVLRDKTRGNLDDDESNRLALTVHQLREQYVQTAISMRPVP